MAGSGLRIGDAEREATAASLREHYAHGRLTIEEFQQRLDATFGAKTELDLATITSDLPHIPPAFNGPWPPPQPPRSARGTSSSGAGSPRTTARGTRLRRSRAWVTVDLALVLIAIFLIVALSRPFGWLEALVPKPVLILVAILVFARRVFRRVIRGNWPRRPRGQR